MDISMALKILKKNYQLLYYGYKYGFENFKEELSWKIYISINFWSHMPNFFLNKQY